MENSIIKNCLSIRNAKDVQFICEPLINNTDIILFRYVRIYDDGTCATLLNDGWWQEFVLMENFFAKSPLIIHTDSTWFQANNICQHRCALIKQVLPLSDFLIINYDCGNYRELFAVIIRENPTFPPVYYLSHREILDHFILFFKEKHID